MGTEGQQSFFVVGDVIIYFRVWDRPVHSALDICILWFICWQLESPRSNFCSFLVFQAIRLKVNPLYLMIPGTIGCSYAFMLPVSTPPNSIAFSSGHLMVKDMVSSFKYIKR